VPLEVEVLRRLIGAAGVPSATSVPATISSPRVVLEPAPIRSELAVKVTVAPGSMVRVTPGATVRSPAGA